jgi:hypothetical protein
MNLMGKILVIINFLFAIVIIGFLAVDFARRTNWKAAFDNADAQLRIARNNADVLAESNRKLLTEINKLTGEGLNQERKTKDLQSDWKQKYQTEQAEHAKQQLKLNELTARVTDLVAESKRRADEIANLGKVIKDRDEMIVRLEDQATKFKTDAINAQNATANTQERNASLLNQVREQQKEIARLSNSPGAGGSKGSTLRPPMNYVKGVIEKLDPQDKSLVQLSIGSDHGLAEGNTLYVYRLKPNPDYLGTLVVVDAQQYKAVARLLPSEFRTRPVQLQIGDEVASKLSR